MTKTELLKPASAALTAHAYEGSRTFEITVREVLPSGAVISVGGPTSITVRCGKAEEIRMEQETSYPTSPQQTGPGVLFTGQVETNGCKL